jgi:Putative Actinobacterial Holin-X, holin superfamily III
MSAGATDYNATGLGRTPLREGRFASRDLETLPSLLRRLADEVTTLFAKELALAKAETTQTISGVKTGIVSVASGGAVTFLGLLFLLLSAMYGLSNVVAPWLAALIVGGVVTLIGVIMLMTGKKKLEPDAPRHLQASLRKDRDVIKGVTQP